MFIPFLIAFTAVPIVELYLLIKVGTVIGLIPTLAVVLFTGVAGAALARSEGLEVLRGMQESIQKGQNPSGELLQAAMVLAGGILLLTPGFLTDLFGLSLLFPLSRALYARGLARYFKRKIDQGVIQVRMHGMNFGQGGFGEDREFGQTTVDNVIDVTDISENDRSKR